MKPRHSTVTIISLLLAGAAVCLGTRHAADKRREESEARRRAPPVANEIPAASRISGRARQAVPFRIDEETFAKRLRSALATANTADQIQALLRFIERFGDDDWLVAMKTLENLGLIEGGREYYLILSAWTERNPEAAMAWAAGRQNPESDVIRIWLARDPDAALAYLEGIQNKSWWLFSRSLGALPDDLPRQARLLAMVPEKSRAMVLQQTFLSPAPMDRGTLDRTLASIDPALRNDLLALRFRHLPGVEEKMAMARDYPDAIGPELHGSIYREWVTSDKEAAIAALETIEPGPDLVTAVHGTLSGLMNGRPSGGTMPEVIELSRRYAEYLDDGMLSHMIWYFGGPKNIPAVIDEVARIGNPDQRLAHYRSLLGQWIQTDPAAAKEWMETNEIPEQVRREIGAELERAGR